MILCREPLQQFIAINNSSFGFSSKQQQNNEALGMKSDQQ